jgi:hypothetical protein
MIKKIALYTIVATSFAMGLGACNSDSNGETDEYGYTSDVLYSSTAVTAFNIEANSDILANLDSVYFTIDQQDACIFNADSLPYETDVTKLIPNITSGAGKLELIVSGSSVMNDTTLTYSSDFTDSIDFTAKVVLRVTSYNEKYTRDYTLKVNVHQVEPDSLYWGDIAWTSLPNSPDAQKTVQYDGGLLTFLHNSSGYYSWSLPDATVANGKSSTVTFPSTPNLQTLTSAESDLYYLDTNGDMYTSSDGGSSWSATGENWTNIYGGYENYILGVKRINGVYYHVSYPEQSSPVKVSADCPISGTSSLVLFENKWSDNPLAMMTGGRTSSNTLTGATWGYDGSSWAKISTDGVETPLEGMSFFPYFTFSVSTTNWSVTEYTTLFAFGGKDADGVVNSKVYISLDQGIHWKVGDDLVQLPDYVPAVYNAQAIVWNSTLTSRSAMSARWNEMTPIELPWWWKVAGKSRATAPITSWECPYIYIYGGTTQAGRFNPQVWRGVINRLTFKPLE